MGWGESSSRTAGSCAGTRANSLKSGARAAWLPCRFQRIYALSVASLPARIGGFECFSGAGRPLSTAALYDLLASRGQAVDKKRDFLPLETYPQLRPHPQTSFYRGFKGYISHYIQQHRLLFNQIWLYHHHIALDLYTDLKLGLRAFGHFLPDRRAADGSTGRCAVREEQTRMACHYSFITLSGAPRGTCKKKPGTRPGFRWHAVPRGT